MNRVYKYALRVEDKITVDMPGGATILTVQTQHGAPCLWVLVNPNVPSERRTFRIIGTGHPIEDIPFLGYVGTFQMHDGDLVFHVFEVVRT